jgi:hypothetical protein
VNIDPFTAGVFGIGGIVVGAILTHRLTDRRSDKEAQRRLWMEALDDTRAFNFAQVRYIGAMAELGVARAEGRPHPADFPKYDARLVGSTTVLQEMEAQYQEFSDPTRRPGMTDVQNRMWRRLGVDLARALSEQDARVARGKSPKMLRMPPSLTIENETPPRL